MLSTNTTNSKIKNIKIKNLVFGGGGVQACAYPAVAEVIEKYGILNEADALIGSSSGGMIGLLLAIGYNAKEIKDIVLKEVDFKTLMDSRCNWDPKFLNMEGMEIGLSNIYYLIKDKGFYKGDKFKTLINQFIDRKMTELIEPDSIEAIKDNLCLHSFEDMTFEQFKQFRETYPELNLKTLSITGTRLTDGKLVIFSEDSHPNMRLSNAVHLTMCFPGGFEPVFFEGHYYADGGIADNYPINYYDKNHQPNPATLGFLVESRNTIENRWNISQKNNKNNKNKDPFSFSYFLDQAYLSRQDHNNLLRDRYNFESISLFDENVGVTDFEISQEQKEKMVQSALKTMMHYIHNTNREANPKFSLPKPKVRALQSKLSTSAIPANPKPIKTNQILASNYTNSLHNTTNGLALGYWSEITIETPADFENNTHKMIRLPSGETQGKKLTQFCVRTEKFNQNNLHFSLLQSSSTNPNAENTLIIVLQDLKSKKISFDNNWQSIILKEISWGLRKINNNNKINIIIHGEGAAIPDARHLQSFLASELPKISPKPITTITLNCFKENPILHFLSALKKIATSTVSTILTPYFILESIVAYLLSHIVLPLIHTIFSIPSILLSPFMAKPNIEPITDWYQKLLQKHNQPPAPHPIIDPQPGIAAMPPIENIVWGASGINGIAYIRALKNLEKHDLLKNLRRMGGGSMGGIISTLFSMSMHPDDIEHLILDQLDSEKLLDKPFPWDPGLFSIKGLKISLSDLFSLYKNKGIYKGDAFKSAFSSIIEKQLTRCIKSTIFDELHMDPTVKSQASQSKKNKIIDDYLNEELKTVMNRLKIDHLSKINFKQLKELSGLYPNLNIKDLYLTGTRLEDASLVTFSAETTPLMPIIDALRIAVSFFGGMIPVEIDGKHYAGGEIADPCPRHIFDKTGSDPRTITISVDSLKKIDAGWGLLEQENKIDHFSFKKYTTNMLSDLDKDTQISIDQSSFNHIQIDNKKIKTLDFNAIKNKNISSTLLQSGDKAIDDYYENYYHVGYYDDCKLPVSPVMASQAQRGDKSKAATSIAPEGSQSSSKFRAT